MAEIVLTRGYVTVVDDDLFDWLNQWKWGAHVGHCGLVYAYRGVQYDSVHTRFAMHRIIAGAPPNAVVDHRSSDSLDNRRANLRIASWQQNAMHTRRPLARSGFRGVWRLDVPNLPFKARIKVNGRTLTVGRADTAEEAARFYDAAAREHFGEFAILNFPEEAA